MKRTILAVTALSASIAFAPASEGFPRSVNPGPAAVRNQMEDRWTGRWVVTRIGTWSDCAGLYTDDLASGRSVRSRGRERFAAGTPARVDSIDVTRSRVSLRLTLSEVLLVTRSYRDITLRDEARCQVDLKVLAPPGLFARGDLIGLEALLDPLVDRHPDETSALLASNFLPLDGPAYAAAREAVVAAHRERELEQAARAYEARRSEWLSQTTRLSRQISTDPDYLDGFARGVEAGRAAPARECADLVRDGPAVQAGGALISPADRGRRQRIWVRGYEDGVRLAQGLRAIEMMSECAPPAPHPSGQASDHPVAARTPARPAAVVPAAATSGH